MQTLTIDADSTISQLCRIRALAYTLGLAIDGAVESQAPCEALMTTTDLLVAQLDAVIDPLMEQAKAVQA